ncbi:unnamed protein product [Polarella glacialis]|uniref:Uncharacterized protein n=2 Tax=Polarella glacialis TaxID=89957 RepID=A0A813DQF0_POLGL|nr:unnamed protein product [Polarella glacialis]
MLGGRYPVNRTFRGGDHYSGDCVENHVKDGKGTYTWANGDVYDGQFAKDRQEGQGKLTRPSVEEEYVGSWLADLRHGRGELRVRGGEVVFQGDWCRDELISGLRTGADGSRYEGGFLGLRRQGRGRDVSPQGTSYEGEFVGDECHGQGTIVLSKASASPSSSSSRAVASFTGVFVRSLPHGSGRLCYLNGDQYDGMVVDFTREGTGCLVTSRGERYDGGWLNDVQEGSGTCEWPGGDVYTGQWRAGQRHGRGRHEKPGQWCYDGPWESGRRHGNDGRLDLASGDSYRGSWAEDVLNGEGSHANKRTGESYRGQYFKGRRCGEGSAVLSDGSNYQGRWEDGQIAGQGQLIDAATGDRYVGELLAGELHGSGRCEHASGDVYEGSFCRGRRHGHGRLSSVRDNETYEGLWAEGVRSGEGTSSSRDGSKQYWGQWRQDKMNGEGKLRCPEYSYRGTLRDGLRDGHGICSVEAGGEYEGQWLAGEYNGKGRFCAKAGGRSVGDVGIAQPGSVEEYDGEWVRGKREGNGVWQDGKGNTFTGTFVDGVLQGTGSVKLPSNDCYQGEWCRGRKHGRGVFRFWDGARIEGEWCDDQLKGTGTHVSAAGERTTRTYGHLTDAITPKREVERPSMAVPGETAEPSSRRRLSGHGGDAVTSDGTPCGARGAAARGGRGATALPSGGRGRGCGSRVLDGELDVLNDSLEEELANIEDRGARTLSAPSNPRHIAAKSAKAALVAPSRPQSGRQSLGTQGSVVRDEQPAPGRPQRQSAAAASGHCRPSGATPQAALPSPGPTGPRVEEVKQEESLEDAPQDRHLLAQLARGLAADNLRLREELAAARLEIRELRMHFDQGGEAGPCRLGDDPVQSCGRKVWTEGRLF